MEDEDSTGVFRSRAVLCIALLKDGSDGPCAGVSAEFAPELFNFVLTTMDDPGVRTRKYDELGEVS